MIEFIRRTLLCAAQMCIRDRINFDQWMKERGVCMAELARQTGVSVWCFKQLKSGQGIAQSRAVLICEKLGVPYDSLFVRQHDDTPLKPGTIHTYHRVLSAVLFRAVKWKYIERNPAERADLPSIAHRRAAVSYTHLWRLVMPGSGVQVIFSRICLPLTSYPLDTVIR